MHWTYAATNHGNVDLTGVTVTDDQGVAVTCPQDTLAVGESMTCTASGTAVAGQYANMGTATGLDPTQTEVNDEEPSHYFGYEASIVIEKSTNGEDADTPTGPYVPVGDPVDWTYEVTNTSNIDLINVMVTDDQGVAVSCPKDVLTAGESMTCTASDTAVAGQYPNLGTVTAEFELGTAASDAVPQQLVTFQAITVSADDPSHYFGAESAIDIEKSTNGDDADTPTGPFIPTGDPVAWEYVVTNTGNTDLTGVTVADDQGVAVTCPQATLAVGESMTCNASGTAIAGQYANVGSVSGLDPNETEVADEDPSHYFGADASIDLVKTGSVAAGASKPGDLVTYTYMVTNTGDTELSDLTVTDPKPGLSPIVCEWPDTEGVLAPTGEPGDSATCTATYPLTQSDVNVCKVDNLAMVTAQPPAGGEVGDADSETVTLSGSGQVGDLVWNDRNRNGVQDPGEPGISGAKVTLTNLDTNQVTTTTTNSSGQYLFSPLRAGTYRVAIDLNSVSGTLTTPGAYTFSLSVCGSRLDADFGLAATLPVTGIDADRLAAIALLLIGLGTLAILATRRRDPETD